MQMISIAVAVFVLKAWRIWYAAKHGIAGLADADVLVSALEPAFEEAFGR
jgi:hypothetical protein